jgi:hypothetical protein
MQRASINRRLDALELQAAPSPSPVLILLCWPDGHVSHDCKGYSDLAEALSVLKPHDHILVEVLDHSKGTQDA